VVASCSGEKYSCKRKMDLALPGGLFAFVGLVIVVFLAYNNIVTITSLIIQQCNILYLWFRHIA